MFRMKKSPPVSDVEEKPAPSKPEPAEPAASGKAPPPRRPATPALPPRPLTTSGLPGDLPRRAAELGATPATPPVSSPLIGSIRPDPQASRDKTMIVGKDVRLKGEVSSCDKMIVEGDVQAVLSGCRQFQIGVSGSFEGTVDVAEADVAGEFRGQLLARERLVVRSTGRITGTVRYAQIVIEAGGRVTGDIATLDAGEPATAATTPAHPSLAGLARLLQPQTGSPSTADAEPAEGAAGSDFVATPAERA